MSRAYKVGIFSGTFDPVHVGHIEFALEAIKQCTLSKVVLLPEPEPRQKSPTLLKHRVQMLQLAVEGYDGLVVLQLGEQQFTIEQTLPRLQKLYTNAQLVFLLGSDLVQTFENRWPGLELLLGTVHLVVGLRGGDQAANIHSALQDSYKNYGIKPGYTLLPSPRQHLASTHVRTGTHTVTDVSPKVAGYIQQHKLY